MKKIFIGVLCLAVLATTAVYFFAGADETQPGQPEQQQQQQAVGGSNFIILQVNNPNMFLNNDKKELDPDRGTTPIEKDGRTLVPIRSIIEAIGGTVDWSDAENKATITARQKKVELWIGNTDIEVDGAKVQGDAAPEVINGRTMLPARIIMESLGCTVQWNPDGQLIIIGY